MHHINFDDVDHQLALKIEPTVLNVILLHVYSAWRRTPTNGHATLLYAYSTLRFVYRGIERRPNGETLLLYKECAPSTGRTLPAGYR